MKYGRRMGWWLAVPIGVAIGLALALALDRAAAPASAQGGGAKFTPSAQQLRINQRISQAAVKRSNRANSRLDQLKSAGTGPAGPPGPAGPAGPAGPGAVRIAFSAAVGSPPHGVLDVAGFTLSAVCVAEAGGGAAIDVTFGVAQASTLLGTVSIATGTDPSLPTGTEFQNILIPLPAGPTVSEGDTAPDGEYVREFVNVLAVTPSRTVQLNLSAIADAAADRCSLNGVAVPS